MRDKWKTGRGRAIGPAAMEGVDAVAGDAVRKGPRGSACAKNARLLKYCY
jgi:hypothetical protein